MVKFQRKYKIDLFATFLALTHLGVPKLEILRIYLLKEYLKNLSKNLENCSDSRFCDVKTQINILLTHYDLYPFFAKVTSLWNLIEEDEVRVEFGWKTTFASTGEAKIFLSDESLKKLKGNLERFSFYTNSMKTYQKSALLLLKEFEKDSRLLEAATFIFLHETKETPSPSQRSTNIQKNNLDTFLEDFVSTIFDKPEKTHGFSANRNTNENKLTGLKGSNSCYNLFLVRRHGH